ncbi:MAG: hypothetical protein K2O04_00160 [Clostridiales bacterium]|nr:hypothetical protein [Clostridiales bacterium]
MDWSNFLPQFLPNLCATLVGFILAILFQQLVYELIKAKITNGTKIKNQLHKLLSEFENINNEYKKINHKLVYIEPIKTPVWDGLINTNELFLLSKYDKKRIKNEKDKKEEMGLYNKLFTFYGLISEYNKWWNLYTTQLAAGRKNTELQPIYDCIRSLETRLFENGEISKLIILIKKILNIKIALTEDNAQ